MRSDRASAMEVDGVEKGVLVFGVDGAHCCHGIITG
jgi:hypothetical protein